jgi:hypothetical protein
MKASIDQILDTTIPNLTKIIDDLIAKETLDIDTLSKRFPELESSILNLQNSTSANVKTLQDQLQANSRSDKQYQGYVDVINQYIDNARLIPEISDRVKKTIFKQKDYGLEYLFLPEGDAKTEYLNKHYNVYTGCTFKGTSPHQYMDAMVFSKLKSINDDEFFETAWLYIIVANILNHPGASFSKEAMTFSLSTPRETTLQFITSSLVNLKLPPLTIAGPETYTYSYENTKLALITSVKNFIYDCENWGKLQNMEICEFSLRAKTDALVATCRV